MNSSFVNLSNYCILEFRANPIGDSSPTYYSTEFYLVNNKHVDTLQVYNVDGYSSVTHNSRNLSVVSLGGSKVIYVDPTNIPIYTSYDSDITETQLDPVYSSNLVMDTMRFHFASGFNFTEVENLIVGAKHKMNNLGQVQIATILLNAATSADLLVFNNRPLFIANTIYDRYIDIKIPAIPWIDADYDEFGYLSFEWQITEGIGFIKNAPITVFLAEAQYEEYNAPNNVTYDQYKLVNYYEGAIAQVNKFDALGCIIQEAADGDYIEFFATWNGAFPDALIASLNESGPDQNWIFSHQLQVYEQIGSTQYPTGNAIMYQEDRFDEVLIYRPILKEAGFAVSMSIDYTLRLINTKNGDQVIKTASLSVINPNKYGKKLAKINLPDGPQSMKVYNKIIQKNYEISNLFSPKSTHVRVIPVPPVPIIEEDPLRTVKIREYVPIKQIDIRLSQTNALNTVGKESDHVIYGQGRLILPIDPVDNLIKFTIYQENPVDSTSQKRMDINNSSYFKLNFGQTGKFNFEAISDSSLASPSRGEMVFRIPKDSAQLILGTPSDNLFYLTTVSKTDGTETMLYVGTWTSSANYAVILSSMEDDQKAMENEKIIADLREQVATLTKQNELLLNKTLDEFLVVETGQVETVQTVNSAASIQPPASQQT